MNLKKQPNHKKYIQILRRMTPEERLLKAFELSEFSKQLLSTGCVSGSLTSTRGNSKSYFWNALTNVTTGIIKKGS
ncbi:hypothetical protein IH824_08430 [candidate division KSB1 bacterium]|nr:hypothetical protein [candidate division KSB1 bacterium]